MVTYWDRERESTASVPKPMRSSGLEPPRGILPTRPSTLRVYQFRHERGRGVGEYIPGHLAPMLLGGAGLVSVRERRYSANTCSFSHCSRFAPRGLATHGSDTTPAGTHSSSTSSSSFS